MLAAVFGVLVGLVMPIQTSANSRLRLTLGSPFQASLVSFVVGLGALLAAVMAIDGHLPPLSAALHMPAWIWSGGVLGVVVLTGNIFLFPRLGSVQTVVLPVTGQVIMGLLIDHVGLFGAPVHRLDALRVLGAVLLIAGVLGTMVRPGQRLLGGHSSGVSLWGWRAAGVVFGMFSAAQTAINGQLGVAFGSAVGAALVSFAFGVVTLLAINLALRNRLAPGAPAGPWWMWIGGFLGAMFVFGNAFLSPLIGTGLTVMTILLGLMAGSLLIDHFGLLGAHRKPVTWLQALGLLLMLAGVAVIRL
ncbi:MAG: DMT family transporter [Corynebacterium sp.]|uniref:DMT family transporter n=1 Tax=Corynebacterium sp. TaxID=1720 RepID=UPI0026DF320E|nr:DMT family transporter [Corynebacterium sp.]MDO5669068.1 DMT family transporter [Corynebacterium sp.]